MAEGKPRDDARDVHDGPNKGESTEEMLSRHEELHREHRERIDALCKHCGMGEPEDDVRGVHDEPNRSRRRHD